MSRTTASAPPTISAPKRGLTKATRRFSCCGHERPPVTLSIPGGSIAASASKPSRTGRLGRPRHPRGRHRLLPTAPGAPPDADGAAHYRQRLSSDHVSVHELVEEFLGSVEFARAHALGRPGDRRAHEVVDTCEGFRIHVDPTDYAVGRTLARTGSYEPDVSATLRPCSAQGATFVDIGANIGWFSLLGASLVGAAGRVVAIEPNPRNVALLRQSAKDNGFDNIEVIAVALSERPGAVALETDREQWADHPRRRASGEPGGGRVRGGKLPARRCARLGWHRACRRHKDRRRRGRATRPTRR